MIIILNPSFTRLGVVKHIITASRIEELNGENILDFTSVLDGYFLQTAITEGTIFELDDDYFDLVVFQRFANEDGTYTVDVESEHVSYRLNDPDMIITDFTATGTPTDILTDILNGTAFSIDVMEFSDSTTYSSQGESTRRKLLMEFASMIGAELQFHKFDISFLVHRGSTEVTEVIKDKNVKVLSKMSNARNPNEFGNPTRSYVCTPVYLPTDTYMLGDNVLLLEKSMQINEVLRIIRISRDPYNELKTTLNFGEFENDLYDDKSIAGTLYTTDRRITDLENGVTGGGSSETGVSTTLTLSINASGDFISGEWEHGYNTDVDFIQFVTTPRYYNNNVITLDNISIERVSNTTVRIRGHATVI